MRFLKLCGQEGLPSVVLPPELQHKLRLVLISLGVLFFELMLIRWVASEIRIFGFFKNLILMAAFLGLGLGCATASTFKDKLNTTGLFPLLIATNVAILALAPKLGLTSMTFVLSSDLFDWNTGIPSITAFFVNILSLSGVFLLITATFDALGQDLGRELAVGPPLVVYALNLLGSLAGIVVYSFLCLLGTPPWVWLAVGFLVVLCFYHRPWHLGLFLVSLALAHYATVGSFWSPYYRIDLRPVLLSDIGGTQPFLAGTFLEVNHMVHQRTLDLSNEFLARHPQLQDSIEYNTYNLPFKAIPHPDRVLVLGAGTGNDVAAALRHGAQQVDAVEIDPTILKLGLKLHPEHPYQDRRVTVHNNDARAYLDSTNNKYNLVVFGHVDSHTTFSTVSSVRLDNYLYTKESLRAATNHLAPHGVAALSFAAGPLWLRARLYQLVKEVANSQPIVLTTHFDNPGSVLILWGPGLDPVRATLESKLAKQLINPQDLSLPINVPTDDWPFLYQKSRNLPLIYVFMLGLVVVVSGLLTALRFSFSPQSLLRYSQFLFLGAGFLLLETRAMLAISVLFGSTWVVNSIVIAIVILMALVANWAVMKLKCFTDAQSYFGLLVSLSLLYAWPMSQLSGWSMPLKVLGSTVILGLPFFFAGIVFSRAFARVLEPGRALGINILGAMLGGCLEYLCVITGTSGLTILAGTLYLASWLCLIARHTTR